MRTGDESDLSGAAAAKETIGPRVLGLWIDGNTIQLAQVSRSVSSDQFLVDGLVGHEDDDWLESVEREEDCRYREVQTVRYPLPQRIADGVKRLLDALQPATCRVVGCMAGESTRIAHKLFDPQAGGYEPALRVLLERIRDPEPLRYPIYLTARREDNVDERGRGQVVVSVTPYSEIQPYIELVESLPFDGVSLTNSRQAMGSATTLFDEGRGDNGILIADVGRMRTHVAVSAGRRLIMSHGLPFGLARNASGAFSTLPRQMNRILRLATGGAPFLFPPEVDPPQILDPSQSTPQVDYTHLARHVSIGVRRALEKAAERAPRVRLGIGVLTGLPSRVPGFRRYIESRTGRTMARPERLEQVRISFRRESDRHRLGDFLVPVAATLRALGSPPTGITSTPYGSAPINLKGTVPLGDIEPGVVYEVDRPFRIV